MVHQVSPGIYHQAAGVVVAGPVPPGQTGEHRLGLDAVAVRPVAVDAMGADGVMGGVLVARSGGPGGAHRALYALASPG